MWGHAGDCPCPVCLCLIRVHSLIAHGSSVPGFVGFAGERLRELESGLRDDLDRRQLNAPGFFGQTPKAGQHFASPPPFIPFPVPGPPPKYPPAAVPKPEGPSAGATPKSGSGLVPGPPPTPPASSKDAGTSGAVPPKEEKGGEAEAEKEPVAEVKPGAAASSSRGASGGSEKAKRRRRRSKKGSDVDTPRKSRRSKRNESSSSRSLPRRREEGGKEKKTRGDPPPEPIHPPSQRAREGHLASSRNPPRVRQGPGWIGPLPVSDHPRWHGVNKGRVKRAKQERHNAYW